MRNSAMSAWFSLWKRSLDIAGGAPEVIAHRTEAMRRAPWAADTLTESNRMVAEKLVAANEAWWSLWRDSLRAGWPSMRPVSAASHTRAVRAANRALKPIAKRVGANKARLRHKAGRRL